jgi:hypothetical protein
MMANKKAFNRYVNAQAKASLLAQEELTAWFEKADISDPSTFRDALIKKYQAIAYKYGLLSAQAVAAYYKTERDTVLGGDYQPTIPDPVNMEQLEEQVRFAMDHFVFPEDVESGEFWKRELH